MLCIYIHPVYPIPSELSGSWTFFLRRNVREMVNSFLEKYGVGFEKIKIIFKVISKSHQKGHYDDWIFYLRCNFNNCFLFYRIDVSFSAPLFRLSTAPIHSICEEWISTGKINTSSFFIFFRDNKITGERRFPTIENGWSTLFCLYCTWRFLKDQSASPLLKVNCSYRKIPCPDRF